MTKKRQERTNKNLDCLIKREPIVNIFKNIIKKKVIIVSAPAGAIRFIKVIKRDVLIKARIDFIF